MTKKLRNFVKYEFKIYLSRTFIGNLNNNLHQENFIKITKLASNLNITIEDLALIWVYQLPFVKIVLTGASTINQLDKNINSLNKIDIELPSFNNCRLSQVDYWNTRKSLSWN